MSFKDDFFEALRSVKRDFFRDTEYLSPEDDEAPSLPAEEVQSAVSSYEDEVMEEPGAEEPFYTQDAYGEASPDMEAPGDRQMDYDDDYYDEYTQIEASDELDDEGQQDPLSASYSDDSYDSANADWPDENADSFLYSNSYEDEYESTAMSESTLSMDGRKIFDFGSGDVFEDDKTIISRNTIIRGALQTDDSIRLLGQVLGDIECKSNIVVAGKVRGNTTAANAYIVDAQIDGNMLCDDSISINNDAWLLGNIRAQQAEIDGKIKGNIEIRHNVCIGANSSVIGNISTDELEIKRGAFVNGQIIMYSPSKDVLSRFDKFDR